MNPKTFLSRCCLIGGLVAFNAAADPEDSKSSDKSVSSKTKTSAKSARSSVTGSRIMQSDRKWNQGKGHSLLITVDRNAIDSMGATTVMQALRRTGAIR